MVCNKSNSKKEVYSNTVLPQEIIKTSNRQPNLHKEEPKTSQVSRRREVVKIRAEINEKKETIVKINKTKSWFLEKINEFYKPQARLIKKKREKPQINKIRNEKGEVTADNAEIQRIIRDYYKQLYASKMDNLKKWTDS